MALRFMACALQACSIEFMAAAAQQREEAVAAAPGIQSREAINEAAWIDHLKDAVKGQVPFRASRNVGQADVLHLLQRAVQAPAVLTAQPAFRRLFEAELFKRPPHVVHRGFGRQKLVEDAPLELGWVARPFATTQSWGTLLRRSA